MISLDETDNGSFVNDDLTLIHPSIHLRAPSPSFRTDKNYMSVKREKRERTMESEQQAQAAPTSSPSPAMAMEETLASVQRSLLLLHQLHCSVSSFTMPSQLLLLERLNGLASELEVMHKAAENCHIQIPLEVVSFIDEGRNPDEYTRNLLNSCVQRNQVSRGKVDAFKALRKHLLEEAEDAFPDEIEAYRAIRNQSSLEARHALQSSDLLSNGNLKVKSEH